MPDFLQYDFLQRAFLAGIIISLLAPLLGTFIVARKTSLLSETFAHTSLAGVGMGLLFSFDPIYGAVGIALIAAIGIEKITDKSKLSHDAIHAIFLSGGLALAVLLTHLQSSATISFETYLFGSLLTVTWTEVLLLSATLITVASTIYISFWQLTLISFNESLAKAKGIKTNRYKYILSILTALVVSLSLKIVGGLLIGALIVVPVLTASQFAKSFRTTLILSTFFSLIFVISGLLLSYFLDVPSGSSIVLLSIFCFLLSTFKKKN